jgi:two-component system nitrogen regulation sensor histidine kinase NtrY
VRPRYRTRFRALILLQIVLLVASICLLAWSLVATGYIAVPAVTGIVVLLQVVIMLRYVEAHVDTLEEFFAAVNYEDFTRRFVTDDLDAELKDAFNHVLNRFQEARAERDVQASYLETVVRHVPVAFFAVRDDGSLSLVNNPARRLTGIPGLHHIEQLGDLDAGLPSAMQSINPGQQQLLQTTLRDIPVELRVSVSEIRLAGVAERLYSIENLSGELTARESSAWRNLIRVLTHEIMNTLTPVTSLAQTCSSMLDQPEATEDIREAITTIARRSEGLMQFVSKYRELLHVPQPQPQNIDVVDVLQGIATLLQKELQDIEIRIEVVPDTLQVLADRALLEQLVLNLVRNAIGALNETTKPAISLTAGLNYGRTLIRVQDNGPGIPDSVIEQVFVPFFTTKRDGSGIGLSLSRQIMTAHGGDIAIASNDSGTTVSLVF